MDDNTITRIIGAHGADECAAVDVEMVVAALAETGVATSEATASNGRDGWGKRGKQAGEKYGGGRRRRSAAATSATAPAQTRPTLAAAACAAPQGHAPEAVRAWCRLQFMPDILLQTAAMQFLAASIYLGLAWHFWRCRWRGATLGEPLTGISIPERFWLLLALLLHGAAVGLGLFPPQLPGMRFGFAIALSLITWLAVAFYWVESFYARMEGLQVLALPLAALCALLPWLSPGQHILANAGSFTFRLHFLVAMLAYSLFTLAALHAVLMTATERRLHRGRLTPLFAGLPPLLTMETLLFRLIHIAFTLLTLTLASGILFSEEIFGRPLQLNHKTIFALLSWLIFAALIIGRRRNGWRGRLALRWTFGGFAALLLAYVGSRFVLEVLLGRA